MERLGFTLLSGSRNLEWRHTAIFSPAPGMHIFWRAELSLQLPLWYFSLEKQLSPVTVVSVVSAVPTQEVGTYSLCEFKKEKKYFMLNFLGRSALSNDSLLAFLLLFFFNTYSILQGWPVHVLYARILSQSTFLLCRLFLELFANQSTHK